ncbi:hypothetical protein AJ80_05885 [Polytolypa hystricis UAMH7299]|uniref:INO80 complex subunit Ies4 n=1 Tax=Polytolypa hystricis (strain UAMH7299) TaxID=1447883 RepID=A0A2B7Y040_POLH7|nr:hypothetical protein AJ80_05885 [Polytolypa hystricis UAMH7299]
MPASDPATASSASSAGRSNKSPKPNKTIVLKLSSTLLSRFPGIPVAEVKPEATTTSASPSASSSPSNEPAPAPSADNASDTASTPAGNGSTPGPVADPKRKGIPGPKPGSKRGLGQGVDTTPRPRGKPGPKKKPRLEDGTIDNSGRASGSGTVSTHKLGPKANQGAINAGLRALDRTGKPCRKWERKGFSVKSFTGVVWEVASWRAPPRPKQVEESSDMKDDSTPAAEDGSKPDNSAVESEKSNLGEGDSTPMPTNAASSPAPVVAVAS